MIWRSVLTTIFVRRSVHRLTADRYGACPLSYYAHYFYVSFNLFSYLRLTMPKYFPKFPTCVLFLYKLATFFKQKFQSALSYFRTAQLYMFNIFVA
jgi:hypothetical protein